MHMHMSCVFRSNFYFGDWCGPKHPVILVLLLIIAMIQAKLQEQREIHQKLSYEFWSEKCIHKFSTTDQSGDKIYCLVIVHLLHISEESPINTLWSLPSHPTSWIKCSKIWRLSSICSFSSYKYEIQILYDGNRRGGM